MKSQSTLNNQLLCLNLSLSKKGPFYDLQPLVLTAIISRQQIRHKTEILIMICGSAAARQRSIIVSNSNQSSTTFFFDKKKLFEANHEKWEITICFALFLLWKCCCYAREREGNLATV